MSLTTTDLGGVVDFIDGLHELAERTGVTIIVSEGDRYPQFYVHGDESGLYLDDSDASDTGYTVRGVGR